VTVSITDDDAGPVVLPDREEVERGRVLRESVGLLLQQDVALMLGIGERRLSEWRGEKIGPDYVKLGKSIYYRRSDVLAWIEANVVVTSSRRVA